jgi:hypothetical protein
VSSAKSHPSQRRSYYDPGARPYPRTPEPTTGAALPVEFTRQAIRKIERELRHPQFHRARREAVRHGWAVLAANTPLARDWQWQQAWRRYWLAMLEHDVAKSRGVAHPPCPVMPHMPGGAA